MAIEKLSSAAASAASQAVGKEKFGEVLQAGALPGGAAPGGGPRVRCQAEGATQVSSGVDAAKATSPVNPTGQSVPGAARVDSVQSARAQKAAQVIDGVTAAQHRLDEVLAKAQSGQTFSPGELLALQAEVYRATQELDLAGKVLEKATSGVKQVLQTQV